MAIVGKSGSGKTTLLKCIYGLEDLTGGSIELNGEPVLGPAYNLIPGHENMKLVSQEFYVLENHTVEENIFDKLIGYTNEAKLKRSKKLLQLLELEALRHTRAKHLSSGQKQRVAIARALLLDPRILILDDSTSSVDVATESHIQEALETLMKGRTSFVIAQRISTVMNADKILVLEKGEVVAQGKHAQLMEEEPIYAEIYNSQILSHQNDAVAEVAL